MSVTWAALMGNLTTQTFILIQLLEQMLVYCTKVDVSCLMNMKIQEPGLTGFNEAAVQRGTE